MSRRRLTAVLICLGTLAGVPAAAEAAKLRVGIADQDPNMFSDRLWQDLGTNTSRLIVSYDAVLKNTFEVPDIERWLAAAQRENVQPLIVFNAPRGHKHKSTKDLPSVKTYRKAVKAFMARFKKQYRLKVFSSWNEVNHNSQPTYRNPKRAAQFTNELAKQCRGCKIVAGDFLDQITRNPNSKSDVRRYIKEFRRHLRIRGKKIWGLHNYSDTNRFRDKGTSAVLKATGSGEVWLTETGGVHQFGRSFPVSESRAAKATAYMFKLAKKHRKRITRLYVYSFYGEGPEARFDAGYVNPDGTPRAAYVALKKRL